MEAKDIVFRDRNEAGMVLAQKLLNYRHSSPLILALPRGGVQIGVHVAKTLGAPLDTLVIRKIGAPSNPELGIGAIGPEDMIILNEGVIKSINIDEKELQKKVKKESVELKRRMEIYNSGRFTPSTPPKTIIIVDDGSATGITAAAAVGFTRKKFPDATIVFSAPVCSRESMELIGGSVNNLVCISVPTIMASVAEWYMDFPQLEDGEVISLLEEANVKPIAK